MDNLANLRADLTELTPEQEDHIRLVVQQWADIQAVSNLLFYPSLVPADIRLPLIHKGLCERTTNYLVLAATVGLTDLNITDLTEPDRLAIADELIAVIEDKVAIAADRASIAIRPFLKANDAERVVGLLGNPTETVRHNLLGWLSQTERNLDESVLAARMDEKGIATEIRRDLGDALARDRQRIKKGLVSMLSSPRAVYVPNLTDC
ncbi:hypothetical protein [Loktanella sp. D2R18]|uniref:hypothetical protein n=1 Tax=Loktanella sp. D2R18 TaxID=2267230 RepID=UPI0015F061EF|nr:hypothetical protein [Loktanella sp. D2R18]